MLLNDCPSNVFKCFTSYLHRLTNFISHIERLKFKSYLPFSNMYLPEKYKYKLYEKEGRVRYYIIFTSSNSSIIV